MDTKYEYFFSNVEFKKSFGLGVAKLRRKKGLSVEKLALKVGVTPKSIKAVEKGESSPKVTLLHRLLIVLEATYDDIINHDKKKVH